MVVENFFQTELTDLCFEIEAQDEWKQLNEELGLDKQLEFVTTASSPIPYPWLNTSMLRVFETLCPCKVPVKDYKKTPIPLEVLKQLSFSKKEGHFTEYEIWYDDKAPDPLLVGIVCKFYGYYKQDNSEVAVKDEKGSYTFFDSEDSFKSWCLANGKEFSRAIKYSYGDDYAQYLIARWGDVKRDLKELREMARERIVDKFGAEIKNAIADGTQALKKLEENALLYLTGEISEGKLKGTSNW